MPGEPAAAAGEVTPVQEVEGQPERAPRGSRRVAQAKALLTPALPQVGAVAVPPDQVSSHRKPLDVLRRQRRLVVRRRELGIRIGPRLPSEGRQAAIEGVGRGQPLTPPQERAPCPPGLRSPVRIMQPTAAAAIERPHNGRACPQATFTSAVAIQGRAQPYRRRDASGRSSIGASVAQLVLE